MFVIAADNQIGHSVIKGLQQKYKVVVTAGNDKDEVWIEKGIKAGANCFISPDLDIPNYLDRIGSHAVWIDVKQCKKGNSLLAYLFKQLNQWEQKIKTQNLFKCPLCDGSGRRWWSDGPATEDR